MQDLPLLSVFFYARFLDLDLYAVMGFQFEVAPLLTGLHLFESDRQGTGTSHFLLMSTTFSFDKAVWGIALRICNW